MQISEITLFKTYRNSGHVGAVLKLSLPKMIGESDKENEIAESFSSFYNSLLEEYSAAVGAMLKKRDAIIGTPIRVEVSFAIEEIKKKRKALLLIKRRTLIKFPGALEREIFHSDLLDTEFGAFIK